MKNTLIEIKNNLQETTVEWMKLRIKSMIQNVKKQKITNHNNKKKNNPTNKDRVNRLWDNFEHASIHILGVPEGEKKEQEIGNLFEKKSERKLP